MSEWYTHTLLLSKQSLSNQEIIPPVSFSFFNKDQPLTQVTNHIKEYKTHSFLENFM